MKSKSIRSLSGVKWLVVFSALISCPWLKADSEFTASLENLTADSADLVWRTKAGFVDTVQVSGNLKEWETISGSSSNDLPPDSLVFLNLSIQEQSRRFYRVYRIPDTGVSITEFMALNDDTIPDPTGLGNGPDWIEIHNSGNQPVSLDGYFLTDARNSLTRWRFPDIIIQPAEYLLVFATGNDQRDPSFGILETDFRLGRAGGYLALVEPGGRGILSEYHYGEQFEDVSYGRPSVSLPSEGLPGFFRIPTPALENSASAEINGPLINQVNHLPDHGSANESIIVTAVIEARNSPVENVTLTYRTMDDPATPTVAMTDDGTGSDAVAGDGVYSALIPNSSFEAGEMVRWFINVVDVGGNISRKPEFLRPLESAEYFGTVIRDPNLADTNLPVLDWFAPEPTWYRVGNTNSREYSQASLYYEGEFIDNFRMRTRGRSAGNAIKPNFKFDFYNGGHFKVLAESGRVEEMNLNGFHGENIWSRSFMRSVMTYDILRENEVPTPYSFHAHVKRNGEFFGLFALEEQVDSNFLERNNLNQEGSLYKASGLNNLLKTYPEGDWSKDQPHDEDFTEFVELVNGISPSRSLAERETYLFDSVTIPTMINYLATFAVTLNHDRIQHNFYLYRDTGHSDEWTMLPWDVDRSFPEGGLLTDSRHTNIYYGDSDHWRVSSNSDIYNRLYDVLFDIPRTREMYQRRLQTLRDRWHGGNSAQLKATLAKLSSDVIQVAALDESLWGYNRLNNGNNGITNSLNTRRGQLFRVGDIPSSDIVIDGSVLVDVGSPVRYHVATSDEGETWRFPDYSDFSWDTTNTGIGFDTSSNPATSYDQLFGHEQGTGTEIRSTMQNAVNESLYLRIPFNLVSTAGLSSLNLNLRFDDGFVAWINGVQVASANAPTPLEWNSGATGSANEAIALGSGVDIDVSDTIDQLVEGQNVLAIQLMNTSLNSGDLLCFPTLSASVILPVADAITFGDIAYNPTSGDQDDEYLELINSTESSIDLSGWELRGGIGHRIMPGTVILAGESLYLSPDLANFRARPSGPSGGQQLFVQGDYEGKLSNFGELVELFDAHGNLISSVTTPSDPSPAQQFLRITELMFNPPPPSPAELTAGFDDNDDFEYIEFMNLGSSPLPLDGVELTEGIDYLFPNGILLGPGERMVLPRRLEAFEFRYGTQILTTSSDYQNSVDGSNLLQNSGETIKLEGPDGSTVLEFRYDDKAEEGWYDQADGNGRSLEIINPSGDPEQWGGPASWQPSVVDGGSPG